MPQHLYKLTGTLRQLSDTEMVKLEAYLQSPYFEVPSGALGLFQYLKKFHPQYDDKKTDPAVIEKKAPALGNQKKQANAGSDLLKAVEGFLAMEDFLASGTMGIHRLKAYKNHHLFDAAKKEHDHLLTELDKNIEQDFEVFYQRHLLTELAFAGFDAVLTRTSTNDLQPVTQTLDAFYALKKLRYQCELLNRQRVLGTAYKEETLIPLLEVLAPFNNENYPYTFLFANVYQMLKAKTFEESDHHYQVLNKFISENTYTTLPQAIKDVISYITNNCQFWNNQGYKQAAVAALNGQELKIKYDVLLENGKIQPSDFRNIVSLAIITEKDGQWIKKFIDGYSDHLPADHAETNKAFALAQYNYYIKNFDSAMPLFQSAQVKDEPIFNVIVRRWQFMCMYEQNPTNTNLLLDFLDAYEKYLQRNAASLHRIKETFTKNIGFSRKLIKATNQQKKNELKEQLNSETYFTGKEWLLQQI